MSYCDHCNKSKQVLRKTAYGELLCIDCWNEYLCTDTGMIEYFIGIIREEYDISNFDADFLGELSRSWYENKIVTTFKDTEICLIETIAKHKGLL